MYKAAADNADMSDRSLRTTKSKSSLVNKNITVMGRRTSIRLEPEMWKALEDMAQREGCAIHDLCSVVALRKRENSSLTAAIRVFIMLYFKAAATEEGHCRAGHGSFEFMKQRGQASAALVTRPAIRRQAI